MAYIVGLCTNEEMSELKRRGWELEDPPKELASKEEEGKKTCMVFVDTDMFKIMDGPDWDKGPKSS